MRRFIFFVLLMLITLYNYAQKNTKNQYSHIDNKVLQIPDSLTQSTEQIATYINNNFETQDDKVRAIFYWIVSNIKYDAENMYAINFNEKKEEKIMKPLKTRKGICENYAHLFNDICNKSGIKSYVIEGYTKQNGFADYVPHAWNAAFVDSNWYLYDPTWGAGYIKEGKFIKKLNNNYYKVNPISFVKTHIPFDYLWQFLNYPITNQEFYEGKTDEHKAKTFFNFSDSIIQYEKQSNIEQLSSSAYRIEKNGIKNSLIFERLKYIKLEIESYHQNQTINLYNTAVADYNEGINLLNDYINYRNKQFTPSKNDAEIQEMLDKPKNKFIECKNNLAKISNPDNNVKNLILQINKSVDDATKQLREHQDWLKEYFSKGKLGRKSMFYKVTILGIPVE